ncbi:MAG: hypothetical protein ACMG5Z_03060 [Luteimonas sp.]
MDESKSSSVHDASARSGFPVAGTVSRIRPEIGFHIFQALTAARIHAECAGTKGRYLEQPAGYRDILQQHDELGLVADGIVKKCTREHGEDSQSQCGNACPVRA